MNYKEVNGDLFKVESSYTLAHCISADCKMGAGIATLFVRENPNMRQTLQKMQPKIGDALYYNVEGKHAVFNLITKERYFHKPTRDDFNKTVLNLKEAVKHYEIKKLAIPLLGSGLDKLSWNVSKDYIKEVFKNTDIEILVCIK